MPIGGIIGGLGSLVGGLFGSSAATKASDQQAKALQEAINLAKSEWQMTQERLDPFRNAGVNAIPQMTNAAGMLPAPPSPSDASLRTDFTASPGYQYQFGQMMDATQNSAAGKTGAISGNMLRALQQNAGGLANQDWWNFYNAKNQNWQQQYQLLQNLISGGQAASNNQGTFGQQAVSNIGGLLGNLGNAQALGTIGSANALSGAFSGLGSAFSGGGNGTSPFAFLFGNNGGSSGGGNFPNGATAFGAQFLTPSGDFAGPINV